MPTKSVACDLPIIAQEKLIAECPAFKCQTTANPVLFKSDQPIVCYNGSIFDVRVFKKNLTGRDLMLRAVSVEADAFPLKLKPFYLQHVPAVKSSVAGASTGYVAVHWRRGDQINTRCKRREDQSVNCQTAQQLVQKVKNIVSNSSVVYVATNEPADSAEYSVLHDAGFLTWQSINNKGKYNHIQGVEVLVVETQLMLDATTFLGWGISEINDVVEAERKRANRSYCVHQDRRKNLVEHDTWCRYQANREQLKKAKNGKTVSSVI